jgi:homoserine O-acetyltransferase
VVVVIHALTGDARVDEWWLGMFGAGKALDPTTHRIICLNNLGSCYGTTGPADADFPRRRAVVGDRPNPQTKGLPCLPEDDLPAPITPWDQARAWLLALDALGIDHVALLTGGSLGGMICLCLAALAPERFRAVVPIATDVRATPWVIGWNHIGRQAVLADPVNGLAIARQLAHMTYRANPGLEARQGRQTTGADSEWPLQPYRMQTYLQHHGHKLKERFHPGAYLSQLDAMDHHDIHRRPTADPHESWNSNGAWGTSRLPPLTVVGIDTDQLFPPEPLRALAQLVPGSTYSELASEHGHDGFLIESEPLNKILARALNQESS